MWVFKHQKHLVFILLQSAYSKHELDKQKVMKRGDLLKLADFSLYDTNSLNTMRNLINGKHNS